ncbi:hypothetical protein ACFWN1_26505 [Streptomyces sp. NPDC058459]|uniref:hypothetical protein n=1 Tax=Streptomyces sp. NPDC058459 TaxID=3346508 RepID=UPI00365566FF
MTKKGGPYPRLRLDLATKATQGAAVLDLVLTHGQSFRQAAATLDMSPTTAWRRFWFAIDLNTPTRAGCKPGPIPPQRGTRACPNGRPYLPTYDGRTTPLKGTLR